MKHPAFHILHSFLACVFALLAGLTAGLVLSPFTELQAQERQNVWFQSSNVLSRQVALQDTALIPRQAERKYEDTIYELHGELIMPQSSSELDDETSLEQNTQLHPAIIFLVGSGPNSTHTGLYADFVRENLEELFLQHGVALMYFDKRGVGFPKGAGTAPIYTSGPITPEPHCNFCGNKPVLIPSELEWLGIHKVERSHKY